MSNSGPVCSAAEYAGMVSMGPLAGNPVGKVIESCGFEQAADMNATLVPQFLPGIGNG